jgi:hypothetical protein
VRVVDLYNVQKIPTTYIISREGDIEQVKEDINEIESAVERLI